MLRHVAIVLSEAERSAVDANLVDAARHELEVECVPLEIDIPHVPRVLTGVRQKEFVGHFHADRREPGIVELEPFFECVCVQPSHPDRPPLPLLEDEDLLELQPDQRSLTIRYVEHSVRFIRRHRGRPFLLYLAHMHVHLPHYPPEAFLRRSRNGPYGAAVECIDWSVAVILHELRSLGLAENTLVLFTSDNGSRGDRLLENGIGTLPVVADDALLGMLSGYDIVRFALHALRQALV